jgi:hypothetical protein
LAAVAAVTLVLPTAPPDHYVDYACVLVRLRRVHPDAVRDLLLTGWRFMTRKDRRALRRPARS